MLGNIRGKYLREYICDYVVFDLETTGVNARNDEIIEISAIKVINGEVADTFSSLVNPQMPISPAASAVNHITDEMVEDAPVIDEVMIDFLQFIGDYPLVGHNIHSFDMKFIYRVTDRLYNKTLTNDYLDTLPYSRKKLPNLAHHRLVDLAAHYGLSTGGAHRALFDCEMNQKCFELMAKEKEAPPPPVLDEAGKVMNCPRCGSPLKKRNGIYGPFYGCTAYPECKYTETIRAGTWE